MKEQRITQRQRQLLASFLTADRYEGSYWHIATLAQNGLVKLRMVKSRQFDVAITDAGRALIAKGA